MKRSFAVYGLSFLLVSSYLDKAWRERSNCGNALTFCAENPLDWLNLVMENRLVLDLENPLEFYKTLWSFLENICLFFSRASMATNRDCLV